MTDDSVHYFINVKDGKVLMNKTIVNTPEEVANMLREHNKQPWVYSSSVDFCEEYGMKKDEAYTLLIAGEIIIAEEEAHLQNDMYQYKADLEHLVGLADDFYSDVIPQIKHLCIQDYGKLNELGLLLTKLKKGPPS